MYVGLDFGTTNSVVSFWNEQTKEVEVFLYQNRDIIPTMLAYGFQNEPIAVADDALTVWGNDPSLRLVHSFKPKLSNSNVNEVKEVQQYCLDFIRNILLNQELSFVAEKQANITNMVISAPELWQNDVDNRGTNNLLTALSPLNLPITRSVSEPLAALAYFCWKNRQLINATPKNILVCDMGGGTNDISYCSVREHAQKIDIEVKVHDGSQGKAGVYDLNRILEELYNARGQGKDIGSYAFQKDLWSLNKQLCSSYACNKIRQHYPEYLQGSDEHIPVCMLNGQGVQSDIVYSVFPEIQKDIHQLLDKIVEKNGGPLQFDYLLFIGGFSNYFLVRDTILKYFQLNEDDAKVKAFPIGESYRAVACGAALLAADQISIRERYPHTIEVEVAVIEANGIANGRIRRIKLIQSGTLIHPDEVQWARTMGNNTVITISEGREFYVSGTLHKNGHTPHTFSFQHFVLPDIFTKGMLVNVGIKVNYSGIATFVLQSTENHRICKEYYLGDILES